MIEVQMRLSLQESKPDEAAPAFSQQDDSRLIPLLSSLVPGIQISWVHATPPHRRSLGGWKVRRLKTNAQIQYLDTLFHVVPLACQETRSLLSILRRECVVYV